MDEAFRWFDMAARQGDLESQILLADTFLSGEDVPKNERRAAAYLEMAARQGDVGAMFELGKLYDPTPFTGEKPRITILGKEPPANPSMVPKSAANAAEWYRRAADLGAAGAQYNLGNLYISGTGVPRNNQKAFKLFQQAARHGDPLAQTNLGALYSQGLGVPIDNSKAYMWSTIAAASGDAQARANRDATSVLLTQSEKQSAERLAATCVETQFQDERCD